MKDVTSTQKIFLEIILKNLQKTILWIMENYIDKENVKILLMLYQQHPCLYVTKSVEYHNRMKRDKAFQTICNQYQELTGQPLTTEIAKKK